MLFSGLQVKEQLPYEGATINTPTPNQQNKFLAGIFSVQEFCQLWNTIQNNSCGIIAVMSEIEFWWESVFPEVFRLVEAHSLARISGGHLNQPPAPQMFSSSGSGSLPSEKASEWYALGEIYSQLLATWQLQVWWIKQISVSSEGRGPAKDGRIGVRGLQGNLLCEQWEQMPAGVPQAALFAADRTCRSQGEGPEQK